MAHDICSVCGKFYPRDGDPYCDDCREKDKTEFAQLRELVSKNPGIPAYEASTITGIPLKTINRYIKERRIFIKEEEKTKKQKIYFRDK